jgi:hypothetical protein
MVERAIENSPRAVQVGPPPSSDRPRLYRRPHGFHPGHRKGYHRLAPFELVEIEARWHQIWQPELPSPVDCGSASAKTRYRKISPFEIGPAIERTKLRDIVAEALGGET